MQREFICGDCMNFLPDFPDNYFDVAVQDGMVLTVAAKNTAVRIVVNM